MNPTVIRGQKVDRVKLQRAKELRQTMTVAEKLLWAQLRANRLGGFHFRRQQVIEGFIVDFYCHRAGLIIEVDGKIHEGQLDRDQERERILTDKGLRIIRVTNREVETGLSDVLDRILDACLEVLK